MKFSQPLLVDFSSSVANSRSRAFSKSICAREKVSMNLNDYALGGARINETDLVVVVLTLTRMIKSVVTGQAPVTLELGNTLRKNTHNPRWYTHISRLTQFMPPPETYKSEIGRQSTMCQVHAGAYVSLLTPRETNYSDCHPRKTTTYISHVVSITTHYAYARQA